MSDKFDTILNDFARKVKADVVATCAKVALIHVSPTNSDDYNRACRDIAATLTEFGHPSNPEAA
jgi:hypothetical protein